MEVHKRDAYYPPGSDQYEPATEVIFDPNDLNDQVRQRRLNELLDRSPSVQGLYRAGNEYAKAGGVMLRGILTHKRVLDFLTNYRVEVDVSDKCL